MSNHNLRVALVWNGTVFHEKTFTQTGDPTVLVGEETTNHFAVPAGGIPDAFEMFERTDNGYKFRFTDKVDLTVTIGDEEFDAEELIEEKTTTKVSTATTADGAATVYEVPIGFDDWGIVHLGDVDIFFQLMEKGEVVAGRGFGGRIEGPLIGTILAAAFVHAAVLISAFMFFEVDTELQDMQNLDRFVKIMVDEPPIPKRKRNSTSLKKTRPARKLAVKRASSATKRLRSKSRRFQRLTARWSKRSTSKTSA